MRSGFLIRVAASILDSLLVMLVLFATGMLVFFYVTKDPNAGRQLSEEMRRFQFAIQNNPNSLPLQIRLLLAASAVPDLFFFLMEVVFAGTPGKLMLGLRIGSEEGVPASPGQLLLRAVAKNSGRIFQIAAFLLLIPILALPGGILSLIFGVGVLFALGSERQTFHDKIASTAIFHRSALNRAQTALVREQTAYRDPPTSSSRAVEELLFK